MFEAWGQGAALQRHAGDADPPARALRGPGQRQAGLPGDAVEASEKPQTGDISYGKLLRLIHKFEDCVNLDFVVFAGFSFGYLGG